MHLFLSNGQLKITAEKLSVWIRLYPQLQAYCNNDICPLQVQQSSICLKNLKDAHWLIKYRKKVKKLESSYISRTLILLIIFRCILNILIMNNKNDFYMFLHVYGTCAQVYTVLSAGGTRWVWVKERGMLMHAALFIGSHPCPCFVPISLWHFRGRGKKQQNNVMERKTFSTVQ